MTHLPSFLILKFACGRDASGRGWDNPYLFGEKKAQRTNRWLNVRRGDSNRLMPFALVSNTGPNVRGNFNEMKCCCLALLLPLPDCRKM